MIRKVAELGTGARVFSLQLPVHGTESFPEPRRTGEHGSRVGLLGKFASAPEHWLHSLVIPSLVIPAFLIQEVQHQLCLCGRDVGVQVTTHLCFFPCLEDCCVRGWVGLSSRLISGVVPLHLTLHLCAELLSNEGPLCLLLHCLSSGCFPWIEF